MLVWAYGSLSVFIISLVGVVIVVFLPCVQHDPQSNLSQVFVGLAIGTLTSDALLHHLPHAFSKQLPLDHDKTHHEHDAEHHEHHVEHHEHHAEHHAEHHDHSDSVWYGMMALIGMIGFFVIERLLTIVKDFAQQHFSDSNKIEKCTPKAESIITPELEKLSSQHHDHEMKDILPKGSLVNGSKSLEQVQVQVHDECHRSTITFPNPDGEGYMHLGTHHHHHHKAHKGPNAAVMVLVGDIIHNLFDGLAIGVAFAGGGISGGLSTSLAVFFHELPHELGDFAIIIRSGMPLRNAIFWNIMASIVCWLGMCLGIFLDAGQDAWLSALIAGTFLYISLVDMMPELDSCPHLPGKNRAIKLTVQLVGISAGVVIMLLITVYESHH